MKVGETKETHRTYIKLGVTMQKRGDFGSASISIKGVCLVDHLETDDTQFFFSFFFVLTDIYVLYYIICFGS